MNEILTAPQTASEQSANVPTNDIQPAQVRLTPSGQKKAINTLVLPATRYALYPLRLSANFQDDIDTDAEYHPDAVEHYIERFSQLKTQIKPLRPGYLYLFVDGYLHQEYKVTVNESGRSLFQKIDLKLEQGKDTRRAIVGLKQPFILAPSEADTVEIGFSAVQWPWLRINTLGGLPEASRFEHSNSSEGISANNDAILAINDKRLVHAGNAEALKKAAAEEREKRLQVVSYQKAAEYNEWQDVNPPTKQSQELRPAIAPQFLEHIAESDNHFLDHRVVGVGVSILHDYLDMLDHLIQRHNLALNFMAKLLLDMQNPALTGEKKALFPHAEHFASATLIYRNLVARDSKSDQTYFSDAAKQYRDLVHVEDLHTALGVKYRQRVNDLLTITHKQLQDFICDEFDPSLCPQLIQKREPLWQQALLDLLACQFEQERQIPASDPLDMPVADALLEFVGNLVSAINALPRSLDLTIDGTVQDFEQYHRDVITNKARQWAIALIDLDNSLWRAIAHGRLDSMVSKLNRDEKEGNSSPGATAVFQVSRRGVQALSEIFTTLIMKTPQEYAAISERTKLAVISPLAHYLGIQFSDNQLQEVIDINPLNGYEYTQAVNAAVEGNPVLLSRFFRLNQPVLLNKLGGEDVNQIEARRQLEKQQFEQNQHKEKQAQHAQWRRQEQEAHIKAEDDYAAIKADLEKQDRQQRQAIADREDAIRQTNLEYNDQSIPMEQEQRTLETQVQNEQQAVQAAQKQAANAKRQRDLAQIEYSNLQADIEANQQEQIRLERVIADKVEQAGVSAEQNYRYYEPIYGDQGARRFVAEYLAQQQLEIDQIKQGASALKSKEHSLASRADYVQSKLDGLETEVATTETQFENAKKALNRVQQRLDENLHAQDSLKTTHKETLKTKTAELNTAKEDYEIFQESRRITQKNAFEKAQQTKQSATATKNSKIADFEQKQAAQRTQYDVETKQQIIRRIQSEAAHAENNKARAEQARRESKPVIDLTIETGQAEYSNYLQGEYDHNVRRVVQLDSHDYPIKLREKEAVIQKVRPTGEYQGQFAIDQKKLAALSEREQSLLFTVFLKKEEHQKYIELVKSHTIITTESESLKDAYQTYMAEDASTLANKTINVPNALNAVLAIVELVNLHAAHEQLKSDGTTYDRLNFLGGMLDTAASMEALALSLAGPDKAATLARAASGSNSLWRSFIKQPLGATAACVTCVWFMYETWRTLVLNRGDDAYIAYGIMAVGSGMGVYAALSGGALAGPVGVIGIGLVLVGTFLVNYVFRENNDLTEYVLARGPFGAHKDMLAHMGFEDVSISETEDGSLIVLLQNHDRLWLEQGTYRLKGTRKGTLITHGPNGPINQEFSDFIENSDSSYSYKTPKGMLYLGKIGEPLAGKDFNDPIEVEQYFTEQFQTQGEERYSTDAYQDKKLEYILDASLWHGGENSAKAYFEALISAFFPLELDLEIVPKRVERHGQMKRMFGNLLRIKYKIPFMAEVVGEPKLVLEIFEGEKKILNEFFVLQSIKDRKSFVRSYDQNGVNIIELDIDDPVFVAEARLHKGEEYNFDIKLTCIHKFDADDEIEYRQPPIMPNLDNAAKDEKKWRIKTL